MKKYIALALFVTAFGASPLCADAAVRITEIAWMGTADSQYSEWLELHNDDSAPVDLSGWKLYRGDGTPIFTFTKSISPGGYLLLERTTASAPDAVPGISDESGTFGGGGLSNSGEDLILKDASGSTVQALNFSSGWPAGDTKTKETMQWNGASWVTAPATPDAAFVGGSDMAGSGGANGDTATTGTSAILPSVSPNVPYVDFTLPPLVYSGTPYEFGVQPVLEYNYRIHQGVFTFNMGDGTVLYTTTADPIAHTYDYPGTYVLSFLYVDPYHQHTPLQATKTITVLAPSLKVSMADTQSFHITNTASTPIDLSGWNFIFPGQKIPVPNLTIIAPNATVTIPFNTFALPPQSSVALADPLGTIVASTMPIAPVRVAATSMAPRIFSQTSAPPTAALAVVSPLDSADEMADTAPSIRNHTRTVVVGVAALFVIVLSILLERFMARQEY